MQQPIPVTHIDGRRCDVETGPEILRQARMRTFSAPGASFRLESPRRRLRVGRSALLDPDALIDALVAARTVEPRESEIVAGAEVVRFSAILVRPRPPKEIVADIWIDGMLRVRRIVAAPRRRARLPRAMTGRVPARCSWRLEVSFLGLDI